MRNLAAAALILMLASGCASVGTLFGSSEADIEPKGSGFIAILPSSLPSGIYTLEHVNGKLLSRGVADPRRGLTRDKRMLLAMDVDVRAFPEARECLRIRRPDGQLVSVGSSGLRQFRVPSIEAAYLQTVELSEMNTAERQYPRNVQIVTDVTRWMANSPPELGSNQVCRVPIPILSACTADGVAPQAVRSSCMASVVTCTGVGALAETISSQLSNQRQGASSLVGALSSGACQAAIDLNRGERPDWWKALRDISIDVTSQSLLRDLTNDNPNAQLQLLTTAAVAVIHYQNCLNDAVAQCRQRNRDQVQLSQQQFAECNARMSQYRRANYFLETYGAPQGIAKRRQEQQARLRELTTTSMFQRVPRVLTVESCT